MSYSHTGPEPPVYLDNAATTRVAPAVAAIVGECMLDDFGNPSSAHRLGITAEGRIKTARTQLLAALGDERGGLGDVVWTSGGTESDALGVVGAARALAGRGKHLVTTQIEHPAVLGAAKLLEREGWTVTLVPVSPDGVVAPQAVVDAMTDATTVVACMLANNELGSIQPVAEIARLARHKRAGAPLHIHCDGVQALGKIPVDLRGLGVDSLAVSAHKINGPKGSGALWLRTGARLSPLWNGGGQQKGLRSGTENVPGIAGLGEAARAAVARLADFAAIARLRDRLVATVLDAGLGAWLNAAAAPRTPHLASISIPGVPAEPLLHALEGRGVYVSVGSACAARSSHGPSHVLAAIGLFDDAGTLRLSLSLDTTPADVDFAAAALIEEARRLK